MSSFEEPLLNAENNPNSKAKNVDDVTPYGKYLGIFRALTFSWINPVLSLGNEKALTLDDIPLLSYANSVHTTFSILQEKLGYDQVGVRKITKNTLAKALFLSAWTGILWTAFLSFVYPLAQYVCPYLIDSFVQCLNGGTQFKNQGYTLALIFSSATVLQSFIYRHKTFKQIQVGMRFRGALSALIFYKSLRLSTQSKQSQGSGELINLVVVDVKNIGTFASYMHDPWLIIFQVLLGLLLLYKSLGPASFVALAATLSVMLSNSAIAKFQEKYQVKLMESRDNRMKTTTETLRNMRVLKMQGWEMSSLSKIFQLREMEALWLKKYLYSSAFINLLFGVSTTFVALVTFGSCIFMGIPLHTGTILSSLATFRVLEHPIYMLPETISIMIQAKVSLRRIISFLCCDELPVGSVEKLPLGTHSDTAIKIIDGDFSWDLSSPNPSLKNINLKVYHGMKVAICGKVGSGKSTLLSSILGEIHKISGIVKLHGRKSYVAQTPWIQSGTIQDNIVLSKEIDSARYEKILEACCLKRDLENLSFGDQTVVGEQGINLSGGQKQRIQIARALYQDADIYLFDDPFSAVDAHTGSHLYKEILMGLLHRKTLVYVTHQVEFLNRADLILVMEGGRIVQTGKYTDLFIQGSSFSELVSAENSALSRLEPRIVRQNIVENGDSNKDLQVGEANEESSLSPAQMIQEEEREKGSVEILVYWAYITTAYGGSLALVTFIGLIMCEILRIGSNFWLTWATPLTKDVKPPISESTLMIVYACLAIGVSLSTLVADMLVATIAYATSNILFRKMQECIFRAPMSFFDATPSGRILNRCSSDQRSLEEQIPANVHIIGMAFILLVTILAVMAAVAWQVLIIFIPLIYVGIWYQRYYIPSARELSRLLGVCRAPIVQYFSETISGATTIRSFELQSSFQANYMKILDTYCRPEFCAAAAIRWLMLRLDSFSSLIYASLLVLVVSLSETIDPAMAGVAVTYGLSLSNAFSGLVFNLCGCETNMISVERILQYMSISSEAPLIIESNRLDDSWPSLGEICISNLQVRYAPHMPVVLHGITCTFPGRMKTGIVGRTGSGKSTLIQALFRIVEPTTGQISIDGIDISLIGLQDLRSRLGIIPQDPVMFQGTIRSNLDPLELYTDHEIWETLDKCQLGDEVRNMERKLDSEVMENGENWSMGQRQLVCLGRVMLKKSKVLVLDEATASVDPNTDYLIQQTLKEHFSHCTIITIAHRMTSVLNGDIVLLLNNGVIEEFDSPKKLLENKSSSFAKLVVAWSSSHLNEQLNK